MKKILGVLSFFLGLGFAVCMIFGFVLGVPSETPEKSVLTYKVLEGLRYFLSYLPIIAMTGFVVSCAVHFGHNPEGSTSRFSQAMAERYKSVIISSLIITLVLSLSVEVFGLLVERKETSIINQPKLVNEYVKVGNNLYRNGYYERAMRYADAALKLQPNHKDAADLKDRSDVEINRAKTTNLRFKLYESVKEAEKVDRVVIDAQQINETYQYYLKAQEAYDNQQWFNAHYYAEIGIGLATPKDPNLEDLKKLSNTSWNNLTEYHNLSKTEDQKAFDKKYEGYLALVEKDDLKAYYIFHELYQSSREFRSDPDVVFYLKVAENRINERCFFIDETFELESFENANDIYFSCGYEDGSKDIIYFKGVTTVKETGNSIQYLRDLTVSTIDSKGNLFRTMKVPYAKVLPVSTKTLNSTTKSLLGIDDKIEFLPYIMLKSVGREKPNTEIEPVYILANGKEMQGPEYMMLAMPYDDFLMLENSTSDPSKIPLLSLIKLVKNAAKYGYSEEVYAQTLMNRILYPLWILILFVLLAAFAWNNRTGANQYFKLTWAFAFPFFIFIAAVVYRISMFIFKLMNYVFLGGFGTVTGITAGFVVYAFMLFMASLFFLARRSRI